MQSSFEESKYDTAQYDLLGFSRFQKESEALVIYIEGDGQAWRTRHQPSEDPSPRPPLALELATLDPSPSVAYIARPGQFTGGIQARNCNIPLWTSHRFSQEVVDAMNQAIEMAKKRAKAKRIHLVGYSGGGAIVMLVAAQRNDVTTIRTVAGNLDHDAWTAFHGVTPLFGSLNPALDTKETCTVKQTHYVGGKDKIIPLQIVHAFQTTSCPESIIQIVPEATHGDGWQTIWPELCEQFYQTK